MGREIRRVPATWEHPKYTSEDATRPQNVGQYRALYDEDYDTAVEKWLTQLDLWRSGKHPDQPRPDYKYYWDWSSGPPDKTSYREQRWTEAEATHFQMYETVSEGTPVTPVFATKQELADYLVTNGDFCGNKWSRKSADAFIQDEWAPSMIMTGGRLYKSNELGEIPK